MGDTESRLILGAGASGMSLAMLVDGLILERASAAGGHAVSTTIDGYTFDRGPHIMFSRSSFLLDCMVSSLGSNVHRCVRNNKVSIGGRLLKYPVENDLYGLPTDTRAEVLVSFVERQLREAHQTSVIDNLADWFDATFGEALTALYFRPYNEKVWKVPLEELSMAWSERIPRPPVADVVRSAVGQSSEGYLHQLHYHYPRRGGYAALMDSWARGIDPARMQLECEVRSIHPGRGSVRVVTDDGDLSAEQVISTIPIHTMVEITEGVPTEVKDAVSRLRTNATITLTLGFVGEDTNQWTAVYIPDDDFLPNRISYPAVFSPENAPEGHFSVQAEITLPRLGTAPDADDAALVDHVLSGLTARHLIADGATFHWSHVERHDPAYVVYTNGYEDDFRLAQDWFRSQGIVLHGRFGSHNYLNVDGCLEQSIALARELGATASDTEILDHFKQLGAAGDD